MPLQRGASSFPANRAPSEPYGYGAPDVALEPKRAPADDESRRVRWEGEAARSLTEKQRLLQTLEGAAVAEDVPLPRGAVTQASDLAAGGRRLSSGGLAPLAPVDKPLADGTDPVKTLLGEPRR